MLLRLRTCLKLGASTVCLLSAWSHALFLYSAHPHPLDLAWNAIRVQNLEWLEVGYRNLQGQSHTSWQPGRIMAC